MNFLELALKRQSVRKYSQKKVERKKIIQLLESARLAPSASNSQPWYFIVVDEPEMKQKVAEATFNKLIQFNRFSLESPVILVLVMKKPRIITQIGGRMKKKEYPLFDMGIVAYHITLQATELGLGTCILGWFDELRIKQTLRIPHKHRVSLLITLGYPPDGYKKRNKHRKEFEKLYSFNHFNKNKL
ncbi:nitroreductase family protein [Bacteroidota bacterium]